MRRRCGAAHHDGMCNGGAKAKGMFDADAPAFVLAGMAAWVDLESVASLQASSSHLFTTLHAKPLGIDIVSCRGAAIANARPALRESLESVRPGGVSAQLLALSVHDWALLFDYHSVDYTRTHFAYTKQTDRNDGVRGVSAHRLLGVGGARVPVATLPVRTMHCGARRRRCLIYTVCVRPPRLC